MWLNAGGIQAWHYAFWIKRHGVVLREMEKDKLDLLQSWRDRLNLWSLRGSLAPRREPALL